MAARRRAPTTRGRARRKTSSAGPLFMAILAMAVGGGVLYYFLIYQNAPGSRRRTALRSTTVRATTRTTTVPAKRPTESGPLKKLEDSFAALLAQGSYKEIVALLDEVVSSNPSAEDLKAAEDYREQLGARVRERFGEVKERAESLVKEQRLDDALSILEEAKGFGIDEIREEAETRASQIRAMKARLSFDGQLVAYSRMNKLFSEPLKDYDYQAATALVDRQASLPGNAAFKGDLAGMKEDFKAVEGLWGHFLKKMEAKVGSTEMFGIDQGEIKGTRDGAFVMDLKGEEKLFTLKDMQPKWVEKELDLSWDESPPEHWYALGLLFVHKGRWNDAKPIFERIGDAHPGVGRQLSWQKWGKEEEAKAAVAELEEAAGKEDFIRVGKLIADFREEHGETQVSQRAEERVQSLEQKAEAAVTELKGAIETKASQFEALVAEAQRGYEAWYNETKGVVQAKYEEDMTDPVRFRKYGTSYSVRTAAGTTTGPRRVSSYSANGITYTSVYGYYMYLEPAKKTDNLKVLEEVLRVRTGDSYTEDQKKELLKMKTAIRKSMNRATQRAKDNMSKFKLIAEGKRSRIRNAELRTLRKIKGGADVSERDMKEALGL